MAEAQKLFKSHFPISEIIPKSKFKVRILPIFGEQVPDEEINFKWTVEEDFEKLGLTKMVKLIDIKLAGGKGSGQDSSLKGI